MVKKENTLTIKTFHIEKVKFDERTYIEDRTLYLSSDLESIEFNREYIKEYKINVINPYNHDIFINSILDFSPIATKVLGNIGEGITHVLTGVVIMLTAVDENGIQVAEFGSSEGILKEHVYFGRAGTPSERDSIVNIDIVLKQGKGIDRLAVMECHRTCDKIVQSIRKPLKELNGRKCDERYDYTNQVTDYSKKVVIVKQVAGQGAMYDTGLFPNEPGGFIGCKSIIDMGNMPVVLTPNEYRDGALRAMH